MITFIKNIFLKSDWGKIILALFLSVNLAYFAYGKYKMAKLIKENEVLINEVDIKNQNIQALKIEITNNEKTISELELNAEQREALIKELSDLKQKLLSKTNNKGGDDEKINENLTDSVNYILLRLQ